MSFHFNVESKQKKKPLTCFLWLELNYSLSAPGADLSWERELKPPSAPPMTEEEQTFSFGDHTTGSPLLEFQVCLFCIC